MKIRLKQDYPAFFANGSKIVFTSGLEIDAEYGDDSEDFIVFYVSDKEIQISHVYYEVIEEPKVYTDIQVAQIIADYEKKISDEVAAVRSEWEKKYDELLGEKISEENKELSAMELKKIEYIASLERKNKMLEEEISKIEYCLITFHGTEFDRETELYQIVNSLVLEVDKCRKPCEMAKSSIEMESSEPEFVEDKATVPQINDFNFGEESQVASMFKRPTIGVIPENIWISRRLTEIEEYFIRASLNGDIPLEQTVSEYKKLESILKETEIK